MAVRPSVQSPARTKLAVKTMSYAQIEFAGKPRVKHLLHRDCLRYILLQPLSLDNCVMPNSPGPGSAPSTPPAQDRKLDGWGEIASYLRREIRTVQRWERNLGLPIRRLSVGRGSAVYA